MHYELTNDIQLTFGLFLGVPLSQRNLILALFGRHAVLSVVNNFGLAQSPRTKNKSKYQQINGTSVENLSCIETNIKKTGLPFIFAAIAEATDAAHHHL